MTLLASTLPDHSFANHPWGLQIPRKHKRREGGGVLNLDSQGIFRMYQMGSSWMRSWMRCEIRRPFVSVARYDGGIPPLQVPSFPVRRYDAKDDVL